MAYGTVCASNRGKAFTPLLFVGFFASKVWRNIDFPFSAGAFLMLFWSGLGFGRFVQKPRDLESEFSVIEKTLLVPGF